jgi:hypothetical protein
LDFKTNQYRLYYGSEIANKPKYDLTSFRKNQDNLLELSSEQVNEFYSEPKKSLGEDRPYLIYLFIILLVVILL